MIKSESYFKTYTRKLIVAKVDEERKLDEGIGRYEKEKGSTHPLLDIGVKLADHVVLSDRTLVHSLGGHQ